MRSLEIGLIMVGVVASPHRGRANSCGTLSEIHGREPFCDHKRPASCGLVDLYNACVADLVFFGKVTRVDDSAVRTTTTQVLCPGGGTEVHTTCFRDSTEGRPKFSFTVEQVFKGDLGSKATVEVDGYGRFKLGQTYLVMAYYALPNQARSERRTDLIITSSCFGSHPARSQHGRQLHAWEGLQPLRERNVVVECIRRVYSTKALPLPNWISPL